LSVNWVGARGRTAEVTYSYRHHQDFKALGRHWQAILSQGCNIALDCFLDILYCFFARLPLTDATWEAGALDDPVTILAWIDNNLSNIISN
jgi:hypothetical protein